ncbi:MAG: hypothetical protein M3Z04_13760 [Chloroflexota bacterium]|nr:hypothetical protein [Chloroflexota bacterium]
MLHTGDRGWLAPAPHSVTAAGTLRLRAMRRHEEGAVLALLTAAGLSGTGLARYRRTTLVLAGRDRLLGCVVVEPGAPALVRSLATVPAAGAAAATLLLDAALTLARRLGSNAAVMLLETAAQIPVQRLEAVSWDALCDDCPGSALVRELRTFAPQALAVRLALPPAPPPPLLH